MPRKSAKKAPPHEIPVSPVLANGHREEPPLPAERVLVFPSSVLHGSIPFTGVRSDVLEMIGRVFPSGVPRCGARDFVPRTRLLEGDETCKQMVSVAVPWCPSTRRVWCFRRGKSEARLSRRISCLPGGHVCSDDLHGSESADPLELCYRAVLRELRQEFMAWDRIGFSKGGQDSMVLRLVGMVNDDSDAVGRVHLGVVYVLKFNAETEGDPRFCPASGSPMGWTPVDEVASSRDAETWTGHVARYLVEHPSPSLR